MMRLLLVVVGLAAMLWPLWAMIIAAFTQRGGFLSYGDLITWRTPVIAIAVVVAYYVGRREHA